MKPFLTKLKLISLIPTVIGVFLLPDAKTMIAVAFIVIGEFIYSLGTFKIND